MFASQTGKSIPEEVALIYRIINGAHVFTGADAWTSGVMARHTNLATARRDAAAQIARVLAAKHAIDEPGEWTVDEPPVLRSPPPMWRGTVRQFWPSFLVGFVGPVVLGYLFWRG